MALKLALLVDFGSTYTKTVVIDLERECFLASAAAVTTVDTDIMIGLNEALSKLEKLLGCKPDFNLKLASSSAAGGLKISAIGLVADLTTKAAKSAALSSGGKILKVYSYELTSEEVKQLESSDSDLILLAGGTDGGDKKVVIKNARLLAEANINVPIIYAGNKSAADDVRHIFSKRGKEIKITENVMPRLGKINPEPVREVIRNTFIEKIIEAKGLKKAQEYMDSNLMPTPSAVLNAVDLLARGCDGCRGLGEILVVDIGGATTDIHSAAEGKPTAAKAIVKGLKEPFLKRTVEGNLGLRVSALSLMEVAGLEEISRESGIEAPKAEKIIRKWASHVESTPQTQKEKKLEAVLAQKATSIAVKRHAGSMEELRTPMGHYFVIKGKDLTSVKYVIGTGGVFKHNPYSQKILDAAVYSKKEPFSLKPKNPKCLIDSFYVLWALGLLRDAKPLTAFKLAKKLIFKE